MASLTKILLAGLAQPKSEFETASDKRSTADYKRQLANAIFNTTDESGKPVNNVMDESSGALKGMKSEARQKAIEELKKEHALKLSEANSNVKMLQSGLDVAMDSKDRKLISQLKGDLAKAQKQQKLSQDIVTNIEKKGDLGMFSKGSSELGKKASAGYEELYTKSRTGKERITDYTTPQLENLYNMKMQQEANKARATGRSGSGAKGDTIDTGQMATLARDNEQQLNLYATSKAETPQNDAYIIAQSMDLPWNIKRLRGEIATLSKKPATNENLMKQQELENQLNVYSSELENAMQYGAEYRKLRSQKYIANTDKTANAITYLSGGKIRGSLVNNIANDIVGFNSEINRFTTIDLRNPEDYNKAKGMVKALSGATGRNLDLLTTNIISAGEGYIMIPNPNPQKFGDAEFVRADLASLRKKLKPEVAVTIYNSRNKTGQ